jgi:hypothetical protein
MTEKPETVQDAIVAVMRDVHSVGKNEVNAAQKFKFRGVDAVVNALAPALRKHGLFIIPNAVAVTYEAKTSANGGQLQIARAHVEYQLCHTSGSALAGSVFAEAFDSGDKATAKAMSVAFRTFLLQTFALPTDDKDPDAETYEVKPLDQSKVVEMKATADAIAGQVAEAATLEELNDLFTVARDAGVSETLKTTFTAKKKTFNATS